MNNDPETLSDFRGEYLTYLEGDRDEPPALGNLPSEERRAAEDWVESITAARGVDPYASRPSIEQLLAARTGASSIMGGLGEALQTHLRLTVDPGAVVTPDAAASAVGVASALQVLAQGMRIRVVPEESSVDLDVALATQAEAIGAVFDAFPDTHAVLYATSGSEPRGVVVDRGDVGEAIETPSGETRAPRLPRTITDARMACEEWVRGLSPAFELVNIDQIEPSVIPESAPSPYTLAARAVEEVSTAGARARIEAKRATWGAFGEWEAQQLAAIIQEAQSGLLGAEHYRARIDGIVEAVA